MPGLSKCLLCTKNIVYTVLYSVHCTLYCTVYTVWPKNCICHYFHGCDGGGGGSGVVVVVAVVVTAFLRVAV